ncbi:glycerol kinase GlpK [Caulobacter hibisci]|uniref:Glycerol kinase n=1 Tax=Caulobacter hibisci TaxID=2035993 RepID=A0ABS0SU72_9CAUL|nr:glycerol kinase GlpK [Caulobacter hibisci]MBI1682192.1 glycerol kinase GlpK [Caulobacter hibisci]
MTASRYILAIDQGTTSTRSIVFDAKGDIAGKDQREFAQSYPDLGWVEHDPETIWNDVVATARAALADAGVDAAAVAAIGIANQRETVVVWDRRSGRAIHPAIVWQDRRTTEACEALRQAGHEPLVQARTGLRLDPYFSASKLAWILDHVPGARAEAEQGRLAFGTIDSFLLWRLTGGRVHATDATNASRTLLFDIHRQAWDEDLLALFGIPAALLPEVRDNCADFGETQAEILGASVPIRGMAGDQQAALIGQACFSQGMIKATYGTGCFMLMNTGSEAVASNARLLTTTAYRLDGKPTYALEGSIFVAGAAIKWLRDQLGLIVRASDTSSLATTVPDGHGVYMVPAFVGLGAPYWDPHAKGLIHGLTLDASAAHIARAALESVAFQTNDLIEAMFADGASRPSALRVDGGMAANDWLCAFLSDIIAAPVERPVNVETTALGVAFLAGLGAGVWPSLAAISEGWRLDGRFEPTMPADRRADCLDGWNDAMARARYRPAPKAATRPPAPKALQTQDA